MSKYTLKEKIVTILLVEPYSLDLRFIHFIKNIEKTNDPKMRKFVNNRVVGKFRGMEDWINVN